MPAATEYISTRGGVKPLRFSDAVLMGLGTDGGLLLPAAIPDARPKLDAWAALDYPELAYEVIRLFVDCQDISDADLRAIVTRSYATFAHPQVLPMVPAGPVQILELFHGPTLAFKDVALQFLGNLFEHVLRRDGRRLNLLGATSGDTGSAAIHGVRGRAGMNIFIMHPRGRVSPLQELQMTTVTDPNVHNIAIEGTFDDGQRVLKEIFNDLEFKDRYALGAVNSVNWARILAQVVYYFWGAFRLRAASGAAAVQVCVPTGNFGNLFAGCLAKRMGAPISRLILATNDNDILARFFTTGVYELGAVHPTLSPSMDIQVASNFERYLYLKLDGDAAKTRELMQQFAASGRIAVPGANPDIVAGRGDSSSTLETIARYHRQHGYLLDPHTAVGVTVAERFLQPGQPTLCLATAHPAKFKDAIIQALGADLARHPALDALAGLPRRCTVLPAEKDAIKTFMAEKLAGA